MPAASSPGHRSFTKAGAGCRRCGQRRRRIVVRPCCNVHVALRSSYHPCKATCWRHHFVGRAGLFLQLWCLRPRAGPPPQLRSARNHVPPPTCACLPARGRPAGRPAARLPARLPTRHTLPPPRPFHADAAHGAPATRVHRPPATASWRRGLAQATPTPPP
jgi:hypothetical protein